MPRISERLWNENIEYAEKCLSHPFVRGIADGTLKERHFKTYIAQDVFYLQAFLRSYAFAMSKSDEIGVTKELHALIGGILEEIKLHESYSSKLGISLTGIKPIKECSAYTTFLLDKAANSGIGETMAAMAPCVVLYHFLGRELEKIKNPSTQYNEWIMTYSGNEMARLAEKIQLLLDKNAPDTQEVHDTYKNAMRHELDFFSGPLRENG
ncbi:TenA family protein [Candidatus Woesearchaeota archaeon]|nr:TenA family protein [Candidatus Woesearchaeota archaeon]